MAGIKRDSSGADEEKGGPLQDVELSDEDAKKLTAMQKSLARTELALERVAQQKLNAAYAKRREIVKSIPKFWPVALMNNEMVAVHIQHSADQLALSYLEDLWVERDKAEPRCYTIEFYFKENPYFSDSVLKKEYKYVPPPAAADETPDEDGITESSLDFSWQRDVSISAVKINWKDDSKNLTKLYPREKDEDDDIPADPGSFFNYFEHEEDSFETGMVIANEIFPEAIEYFLGTAEGQEDDSEDEDSEDDDAEEIDLEKPRTKKRKV
ncbi:hypothetical protein EYR40_004310 [Pleurotus pulmonarius]|nr:hypothetical protein EYR36_007122 [Pleurotus pulmonarius]KAF4605524.1 hypothetical protein EYR40_004310 [Pleurotus pulmonarius]KAF4607012.1 hypothetical protein EYR38_001069 [Pleurotus pulmonarius]